MSVKGQGYPLTLVKGHSDFKVKTVGPFKTKAHMKAERRMGIKTYTNELGHITNMVTMPIYGKNLTKSSSPEPIDR